MIWSILVQIIGWIAAVAWWLLSYVLWTLLWLALPLLVLAFVAFRAAGYVLGKATVEAWARRQVSRLGAGAWRRARRIAAARPEIGRAHV